MSARDILQLLTLCNTVILVIRAITRYKIDAAMLQLGEDSALSTAVFAQDMW